MRNLYQKRKSEGFTIIEVMIVLAIAGLILLIVFLAVPALQRNAHNTSIKNDVAGILGAVNEYTNNNNGALPATLSIASNKVTVTGAAGAGTNPATGNVGYMTTGSWTTTTSTPVPTTPGTVVVVQGVVCNATGTGPTTTGASARTYAALFSLEGGALQCQSS